MLSCRVEYEDQQDKLLKAMKQNVGPNTQMVRDTRDERVAFNNFALLSSEVLVGR